MPVSGTEKTCRIGGRVSKETSKSSGMKEAIYWVTNDWTLIRRIREKYRLPQQMNINYTTYAEVDENTLAQLKKGEPKFLIIRKIEK